GSWASTPTWRESSTTDASAVAVPFTDTLPVSVDSTVCGTTPVIACSSVDLPDPEAPNTIRCSPGASRSVMPRSTAESCRGNSTETSWSSRAGSAGIGLAQTRAPDREVVHDAGLRQGVDDQLRQQPAENQPGDQVDDQADEKHVLAVPAGPEGRVEEDQSGTEQARQGVRDPAVGTVAGGRERDFAADALDCRGDEQQRANRRAQEHHLDHRGQDLCDDAGKGTLDDGNGYWRDQQPAAG